MNMNQLINWLPQLLAGLKVTMSAAVISMFTSIVWGSMVASLISLKNPLITATLRVYTSIFRNSPLLVQMFFCFYGLPYIGVMLSPLTCGVLAITLNEGAFIAEIIRGSIKNIPRGEVEAAQSLGLSRLQIVRQILFPLAFRASLPMITGQASIIIKDTSLMSLIMILDITRAGNMFYSKTFSNISIWIVAAIYILLFLTVSSSGKSLEKKMAVRR